MGSSLIRNRTPPRTAIGPYTYAYCRVLVWVVSYERGNPVSPLGPLGSSSSQHRRTPELVLQKNHAPRVSRAEAGPSEPRFRGGPIALMRWAYRGTLLTINSPTPLGPP